jgi:hypothetical protein
LEKSLSEQEAKLKEMQRQVFEADSFRAGLIADMNALQGSIQTLRWCLQQYEQEQDAKA